MVCYSAQPTALYGQRSAQYDWKKLDQALALTKKELRMEAFRDMDIHLQQELILLPLYHYQHQMHHAERVQGHQLNCLGWVNFKDIWFDDGCSDY